MSSMVTLRRRTKSVRSTRQITKAMEMISASKMKRAAEASMSSRPYSEGAERILGHLSSMMNVSSHPFYMHQAVKSRLYIVISSNRGLSGPYNKNVLQEFAERVKRDVIDGVQVQAILVGRQAARFAARVSEIKVLGVYDSLPERPSLADVSPLTATVFEQFSAQGTADEVTLVYTKYVSHIDHRVSTRIILPAGEMEGNTETKAEVSFEPGPMEVLEVVTRRLVEAQLLQAYLESQASEQSARMLAMKTASDNAKDLIDDLVLTTNTLRQAIITRELAEITGGAEALV